ncbi:hypothetical protein [Streptomyces roseoviridis]|uniref:Lipoprotein n=1 Tax=Streptomyces roseoviridis TaxID=67361 RepID=A0ABV5QMR1_9ACTN
MTAPLRRTVTAAAVMALASLLASGCRDTTTPTTTLSGSATTKPTGTRAPAGDDEEAQGERARAALETVSPDDPEFVESGLERVADGVHHRSALEKGKTYTVSVACVGAGAVKVVIADKAPHSVPCDGVPASQRVENAPAHVPIDVTAASGAMGMVAWQIVSLPS